MALDYFPWWVDRKPVRALALYNGSDPGLPGVSDPSIWGLNRRWKRGGVSWLVSELSRLYGLGYRRFMLSLPAGRHFQVRGGKLEVGSGDEVGSSKWEVAMGALGTGSGHYERIRRVETERAIAA